MKSIFIIGGSGYVGHELVKHLQNSDYKLFVPDRGNSRFHLGKYRVTFVPHDEIAQHRFDVVINLAYPNSGNVYYSEKNREIFSLIRSVSQRDSKIIHVSTQAVFGYAMDAPIVLGPVSQRLDYPYVQSKIELENMLVREFSIHNDFAIVRLGNVWGPGSQYWTAAIAHKLLFGDPIGVIGINGFSNITDVKNVVSYLSFLINSQKNNNIYHHLAEFSGHRWSEFIDPISSFLDTSPRFIRTIPGQSVTINDDINNVFSNMSIMKLVKELARTRKIGAAIRSLAKRLPQSRFEKIKRGANAKLLINQNITNDDRDFLNIICSKVQFVTSVDENWKAPVSFDDSIQSAIHWLKEVRYR